jgi:hypothetical protein
VHDYAANQASSVSRRTHMSSWHPRVRVCTIDKKKRPNSLIRARRANNSSGEESRDDDVLQKLYSRKKIYRTSEQRCVRAIFGGDKLIHEIKTQKELTWSGTRRLYSKYNLL